MRADNENDQNLIVPGKSIGLAELGSVERNLKVLGDAAFSEVAAGRIFSIWYGKPSADGKADSTLIYSHGDEDGTHHALEIGVTSAFFHTKKGVSTNGDLTAVWREFPGLRYLSGSGESKGQENVEIYDDAREGISFAIERARNPAPGEAWGRCCAIMVHEQGQESRAYFPRREVPQKSP